MEWGGEESGRKGAGLRDLRSLKPTSGTAPGSANEVEEGWVEKRWRLLPGPFSLPPSYLSRVDLVVHSLKDLPTVLPPGFTIGAVCK